MNSANRQAIHTNNAPAAIGPYSQAISIGNLVFCSGQLAIKPATNQIDEADWSVGQQTRQALTNLKAVLAAAGSDLAHVVKTTVFLAHISDFAEMNNVYAEFFPPEQNPPARSTVEVGRLPKDGLVEIECIAVLVETIAE
jgi:2-iminobutanoate/2-iminopropanoate deaminase